MDRLNGAFLAFLSLAFVMSSTWLHPAKAGPSPKELLISLETIKTLCGSASHSIKISADKDSVIGTETFEEIAFLVTPARKL
jgi:hypothetical protein